MYYAVRNTGYGAQIRQVSEEASANDIKHFTTDNVTKLANYLMAQYDADMDQCEAAIACMLNAKGEWIDV